MSFCEFVPLLTRVIFEKIIFFFTQNGQIWKKIHHFESKWMSFCKFVPLLKRVLFVSASDKSHEAWANSQQLKNTELDHRSKV